MKRKRITFEVAPELHEHVKMLATRRRMSINLWMMRAINEQIKKETLYEKKEQK